MPHPLRYEGERKERVLASSQYDQGRFHNPTGLGPRLKGSPLPLLGEYFFGEAQRRPPGPLPVDDPRPGWARPVDTGLRVTWLGHSMVLLEIDGLRVLTDPVFGERASPMSFAGPRRFHEPPVPIDALPELDLVLLSHDHYDHMCASSMAALGRRGTPIVTALGVGARLEALSIPAQQITELDWNESFELRGLRITATPSQHFSGRGFADRNKTLWASWVLATARHRVFFSGDTGLTDAFSIVGAQHGPFDLTMLEIGAFHPAWGDIHLGPANALTVFEMLGGGTLLPVHWGTFSLGLHAWDAPGEELLALAEARGAHVLTPRLGRVFEPAQLDGPQPWWRAVRGGSRGSAARGGTGASPPSTDERAQHLEPQRQ